MRSIFKKHPAIGMIVVKFKKLRDDVNLPKYQTELSVGMDLEAAEDCIICSGSTCLIKTGLAVELPPGFEMQIRPRSGMALKESIIMPNAPGTIDADYRGEIGVILHNYGKNTFMIAKGQRIAQAVISRVDHFIIQEVDDLSPTERGAGGFGHTGA